MANATIVERRENAMEEYEVSIDRPTSPTCDSVAEIGAESDVDVGLCCLSGACCYGIGD